MASQFPSLIALFLVRVESHGASNSRRIPKNTARAFMIESIHHILGTAPQARDTPDGHDRVENHRWPQRHSVQSQTDMGESEESGDGEVVKQHGGDQSPCSPALCVSARQPASDTQRKQRNSGDAPEHRRGGSIERRTEQQLDDDGGHGHQAQAGGRFEESREF